MAPGYPPLAADEWTNHGKVVEIPGDR